MTDRGRTGFARTVFDTYHPAVVLIYLLGIVVFGLAFDNPLFQAISLLASLAVTVAATGMAGLRSHAYVAVLFVGIAVLNPLFNASGNTVLFTLPWGRAYTAEALLYGCVLGSMLTQALLWFAVFHATGGSERISYVLARHAPALSLILTMALALIPRYRRKASEVSTSRAGIGLTSENGRFFGKVRGSVAVLSNLTGWAFESSVTTADSMRSRGYGTGPRTSYVQHRLHARDIVAFAVITVATTAVVLCSLQGDASVTYFPSVVLPEMSHQLIVCLVIYAVFVLLPTALIVKEDLLWRFSISAM